MAKSHPDAQTKSSLSDCTWFGKMSMRLDLEILLKFPNVARESGSLIILFFSLFFFSSFFITLFHFIYIFFRSSLFVFSSLFLLPLNSRLH
jgi:hypothetical protein